MSVYMTEADIAKVPSRADRCELRNFQRFLKLYPLHGFDMLSRKRWQKYLGITPQEGMTLQLNPPFKALK